jgi:hypothetical protein
MPASWPCTNIRVASRKVEGVFNLEGSMSIKEDIGRLFEEQTKASSSFRATLEPVANAPDKVKITPYDGSGCGCERAMIVAIDHIQIAERDGDAWHDCCGKRLRVCNVTLTSGATVLVTDLLAQRSQPQHGALPASLGDDEPWMTANLRSHFGHQGSVGCPRGTVWCECRGACLNPQICWHLCGPRG